MDREYQKFIKHYYPHLIRMYDIIMQQPVSDKNTEDIPSIEETFLDTTLPLLPNLEEPEEPEEPEQPNELGKTVGTVLNCSFDDFAQFVYKHSQ